MALYKFRFLKKARKRKQQRKTWIIFNSDYREETTEWGKEYLKSDCRRVPHVEPSFKIGKPKTESNREEALVCRQTTLMWNAWTLFESDTCILWIVNKLAKAAPRRSRVFSWCWLSKRSENFNMSPCPVIFTTTDIFSLFNPTNHKRLKMKLLSVDRFYFNTLESKSSMLVHLSVWNN